MKFLRFWRGFVKSSDPITPLGIGTFNVNLRESPGNRQIGNALAHVDTISDDFLEFQEVPSWKPFPAVI